MNVLAVNSREWFGASPRPRAAGYDAEPAGSTVSGRRLRCPALAAGYCGTFLFRSALAGLLLRRPACAGYG
jgi:hypothetical protein